MKKAAPQNRNRSLVICGLVFLLLASMLWDTVGAYLAGGADAPTLPILLVSILVLGGGMVFSAVLGYRQWKETGSSAKESDPTDSGGSEAQD